MRKSISLFEELMGIGVDIDVTDPKEIELVMWYEDEESETCERGILLEGKDYYEKFVSEFLCACEESSKPDEELAQILQHKLFNESGHNFDVDDTFVDEFWALINEVAYVLNNSVTMLPIRNPTSLVVTHLRRKGIDIPEKESSVFKLTPVEPLLEAACN